MSVGTPFVPRGLADVDRRLDAQAADAALDDVLEQVAVVAGHLDHEGVRGEAEPLDRAVDEPAGVLDPGGGEGGEVGVLGERLLGRDQRRDLGEQAALADAHVQRVGGLRLLDGRGGEEQLARRGGAEVEEAAQLGRSAEPARDRRARSAASASGRVAFSVVMPRFPRSGRRVESSFNVRSTPSTPASVPRTAWRFRRTRVAAVTAARGAASGPGVSGWRPVRRGVMAAPQILVLMVQVRILAAELLVRRRSARYRFPQVTC